MDEPLEDLYLRWLYEKVCNVKSPSFQHKILFAELYNTEFVWLVSGDDNRAEDGIDLRRQFVIEQEIEPNPFWLEAGCSVLECLVAFSYIAAFETDDSPRYWFWVMMENLEIASLNGRPKDERQLIKDRLNVFIWRTYSKNGVGGLFPLSYTNNDQTKLEIWYQFNEYLYEHASI